MSNPKCPLDGAPTVLFSSFGIYKCAVCQREYSTKSNLDMYNACLEEADKILLGAVEAGLNPTQLLIDLATRHLMSDNHDPAHMNGIEFAQLFQAAMLAKNAEVPTCSEK